MRIVKVTIEMEVICQDHVTDDMLENPVLYYNHTHEGEEQPFKRSAMGTIAKTRKVVLREIK